MVQGYKIFYGDRYVFLTSKITKSFEKNDGLFYKYGNKVELEEILAYFDKMQNVKMINVFHDDVDVLFDIVKSFYTIQEAAGGVVKAPDGKYLSIFRRGKWDLPKGKVEKGEFYKQTAIREVMEECGLKNIEAGKKLTDTYHVYTENSKNILKRTVWFEMTLKSNETPVVQAEEDITDYTWFDYQSVKEIMKNTYESIKDIFILTINSTGE